MIILEKYQIIEEVGRGGMGLVYRALDLRLGRTVALKELIISPTIIGHEKDEIIARFKQEAQTAAFLNHPNIITIYDVGDENNRYFIAMEFLPGKTLKDYLDEDYKYDIDEILDILIQIASGLDHAHSKGIIHRDIKPDNMKILTDNIVKITDFGIARIESSTSNLTQDGTMLGTLGYISPEQLHNSKGVDSRADIFSFGAMMYEIFTKKLPFDGGTVGSTILKIMTENPVPPRKIVPQINEDIEEIILKCLAKDPSERYQKFKDVVQELTVIKVGLNKAKEKALIKESQGKATNSAENFYQHVPLLKHSINAQMPKSENLDNFFTSTVPPLDKPPMVKPELNNDPKNSYQNVLRNTGAMSSNFTRTGEHNLDAINKPSHPNLSDSKSVYNNMSSSFTKSGEHNIEVNDKPNNSGSPDVKSVYNNQLRTTNSVAPKQTPANNQQNSATNNPSSIFYGLNLSQNDIKIAFLRMFGKSGVKKGDFSSPRGLAVSNDNLLFIADTQNRRVQVFNGFGNWQHNIQISEMQSPCDIAFDQSGKIYVTDSMDAYIRVFDVSGNLLNKFGGKNPGSGQLKSAAGITISQEKVYVIDVDNYRIAVFSLSGNMQAVLGKFGTRPGEYKSPYSIASDDNRVYIMDYGFPRVQIIDKDGISRLVFGERGTMKGQFSIPKGIGVDQLGRIYVCDTLNHRVQVFDKAGKWIYSFGSKGNGQGQFMGPEAISISNDGHIYILDKGNSRVQVFTYDV